MFSWTETFPLISNIILALLAKSVFCSIFLEWQSIQKNKCFLSQAVASISSKYFYSVFEIYPPKYFVHPPQQPDTMYYFFESLFFFSFPAFSYYVFKKRLLWSHIEYCSLFIFFFSGNCKVLWFHYGAPTLQQTSSVWPHFLAISFQFVVSYLEHHECSLRKSMT